MENCFWTAVVWMKSNDMCYRFSLRASCLTGDIIKLPLWIYKSTTPTHFPKARPASSFTTRFHPEENWSGLMLLLSLLLISSITLISSLDHLWILCHTCQCFSHVIHGRHKTCKDQDFFTRLSSIFFHKGVIFLDPQTNKC